MSKHLSRRTATVAILAFSLAARAEQQAAPTPDDVIVFTRDGLAHQDMLPVLRKTYKEWGVALFSSTDKLLATVKASAAKDGMTGILVTYSGMRQEMHNGIGTAYDVVEATGVKMVEPTSDNVIASLRRISNPIESDAAYRFALERNYTEAAPAMLALAKQGPAGPRMVHGYAVLMQQTAAPELEKVLRFHPDGSVRLQAGRELLALGQRKAVEDAAMTERNESVATALKTDLMR